MRLGSIGRGSHRATPGDRPRSPEGLPTTVPLNTGPRAGYYKYCLNTVAYGLKIGSQGPETLDFNAPDGIVSAPLNFARIAPLAGSTRGAKATSFAAP